jgi:BirA family biotin operon repressor/biotin-[acetyl-CoA-carboxylase] ligase
MKIGDKILYRERVTSTNDLAEVLLKGGEAVDGTIIYAGNQIEGRGQKGNRWESSSGMNLTMSLILQPQYLAPERQFMISKAVSLSIVNLLKDYSDHVSIKWPNDIYIRGDKIAGILIENSIIGNTIECSIAGIGINLNQETFSNDIPNPISLKIITGKNFVVKDIIDDLSIHLNYWYSMVAVGDFETIDIEYTNCLYQFGIPSTYIISGLSITGVIRGVDQYGHLLLEDDGGVVKPYAFKDIAFSRQ